MSLRNLVVSATALATASCAEAPPKVSVSDASAAVTPTGGAIYFTLINEGGEDLLTAVSANGFGRSEVHRTTFDNGVMRMRPAGDVIVPASGKLRFNRSGLHVMLTKPQRMTRQGETIAVRLEFARHEPITFRAPIVAPGGQ